jgi:hypothetical protein
VKAVQGRLPRTPVVAAFVGVVLAAAMALAFAASPASAFSEWRHDGATTCSACHTSAGTSDATCTGCHAGFRSYPGMTCWSCHAPGEDTSDLSAPSSACSQGCHLWDSARKQYNIPSTHGANPHLGSSSQCLGCHPTSPSWFDAGDSPHHSGEAPGISDCGACHGQPQKHAGKVACTTCHSSAAAFHTFAASSPGYKKCGSCHTMRHAGKKVATSRCATCHKGSSGRSVQHSSSITRSRVCGGCHGQKLHARAVSNAVKDCTTCHRGRFHASQPRLGNATCERCHQVAKRHDGGFRCTLCHRRAVHATRPSPVNL